MMDHLPAVIEWFFASRIREFVFYMALYEILYWQWWSLVDYWERARGFFMALELEAGVLRSKSGTIRYHPAFAAN